MCNLQDDIGYVTDNTIYIREYIKDCMDGLDRYKEGESESEEMYYYLKYRLKRILEQLDDLEEFCDAHMVYTGK